MKRFCRLTSSICALLTCYDEMLSATGRVHTEDWSHPTSFGQTIFAAAKEAIWWIRLNGLKHISLFGQSHINFFKFHLERKMRVERVVLPLSIFAESLVNVTKVVRVRGPSLITCLSVSEFETEKCILPEYPLGVWWSRIDAVPEPPLRCHPHPMLYFSCLMFLVIVFQIVHSLFCEKKFHCPFYSIVLIRRS